MKTPLLHTEKAAAPKNASTNKADARTMNTNFRRRSIGAPLARTIRPTCGRTIGESIVQGRTVPLYLAMFGEPYDCPIVLCASRPSRSVFQQRVFFSSPGRRKCSVVSALSAASFFHSCAVFHFPRDVGSSARLNARHVSAPRRGVARVRSARECNSCPCTNVLVVILGRTHV